jgi:AraC-like DNA-binding protein
MYTFRAIAPSPALNPFVQNYSLYSLNLNISVTQTLVPSNLQNIGFILCGSMQSDAFNQSGLISRSYVIGQITRPVETIYNGILKVLCINFTPTGMYRLFEIPMNEFANKGVDFELIDGIDGKCVYEQITACIETEDQVDILEKYLRKRVPTDEDIPSNRIEYASNKILIKNGNIVVRDLAGEVNMSERNFVRHFIQKVGVSPKNFAGIARMKKAMQMIEVSPYLKWKDITETLEYTDKMHFMHDFKKYAGKTPAKYFHSKSDFEHFIYSE